jgi:hypothetical protein
MEFDYFSAQHKYVKKEGWLKTITSNHPTDWLDAVDKMGLSPFLGFFAITLNNENFEELPAAR